MPMQSLEVSQKPDEEEGEEKKEGEEEATKKREQKIGVVSMCMNNAGNLVFAGCTDSIIRVFEIKEKA